MWKANELVTVGACGMCVVGHGYDGLDVGRDGGGGWYACKTNPRGLVARQEMP